MTVTKKSGYRLHLQRLLFSGGEVVRTVKFPLKVISPDSAPLKEKFEQNIIADDLKIRGSLNLPDFVQNPTRYTLTDFWVDSLRAGAVWQPTGPLLTDFVRRFFNEPTIGEVIFEKAAQQNKDLKFFEKDIFITKFILPNPKRANSSPKGFFNTLSSAVKPDYKNSKGELEPIAEEIVTGIVGDFYDESGRLSLQSAAQEEYWLKTFKIDKSPLKSNQTTRGDFDKLTFFVIPQLINLDESLGPTDLVELRKRLFCDPGADFHVEDSDLIKLVALENKFNALSHYLNCVFRYLHDDRIDEIFIAFTQRVPTISQYENEVKEALRFLSEKTRRIGHPQIEPSWHEYRSVFGGKIQSWFSNDQRRDKELAEQLEKLQKGIENAYALIEKTLPDNPEARNEADKLKRFLQRIETLLENNAATLQNPDTYEVFSDLLARTRRDLNTFYQKYIREEVDETPVDKHKKLAPFYTRIYKPMSFFARQRLKANGKIVNHTVLSIEQGLKIAEQFLAENKSSFVPASTFEAVKRKSETPEDIYRRALQALWERLVDKRLNSHEFRTKYTAILKRVLQDKVVWEKLRSNSNKYCFYQSPYAKGTRKELTLPTVDYLSAFKTLVDELCDFAVSSRGASIFEDKGLLQDRVELLKTLVSLFIRFNTKEEFAVADLELAQFQRARRYLELFNLKSLNKNEAAYFYQSLIFSELRGAVTVFSKEKLTSRYVLQVMKTNEKFPLFYFAKDRSLELEDLERNRQGDLLSQKPHYYCVAMEKMAKLKPSQSSPFLHLEKNEKSLIDVKQERQKFLLRIGTSPYQQQFLERFVSPTGDWRTVKLTLAEWSFVLEKDYTIEWDKQTKKPKFSQTGDSRLYLAVPFQIAAEVEKKNTSLDRILSDHAGQPILGIDVGEYGVGWVLAKFNGNIIDILNKGFIRDRNIAAIRENFAAIQRRAKRGLFNVTSTAIAQVRENAVGAVRNQIHDILTREKAGIVYEYQISNFETGSGRVTKVYNSVKRADVTLETNADKQRHAHVWGKFTKLPGTHLSAYASSYTCTACARSIYSFNQEDVGKSKVTARQGNIITIKTLRGEVCGYTQAKRDKKINEGHRFNGTKEGSKQFLKVVKQFARPPVCSRSESIRKFAPRLSKDRLEQIAKERGNSAIFVCPFTDCHQVIDADIQAALMMAIRGYLRWSGAVKSNKRSGAVFLDKTLNLLEQNKPRLVESVYVETIVS